MSRKEEVYTMEPIPTCHRFDFDKVKTIDDIKAILRVSQIVIYDNFDGFDEVKHLLEDE